MTIEEMRNKLIAYCHSVKNPHEPCHETSRLYNLVTDYCHENCATDEEIRRNYGYVFGSDELANANQAIKADAGKARLTLVPQQILWDIAEVRAYGLKKYGSAENWKKVEIERYKDAAFRHFLKYLRDPQGVDEESGISHLKHLACNIAFLCELEQEGKNHG